MKDLETLKQNQISEEVQSIESLEFSDIIVYNEMADQTSVKINLLEQVQSQLKQLEELTQKRQFMMKEVLGQIID